MKYVVAEVVVSKNITREMIFVFPQVMVHALFAQRVREMLLDDHDWQVKNFVSAGEIDARGICYGRSETMGLVSRGEVDTMLWNMMDYGGGV